jgi:tripartite-type tricarboxylate transporter receptor subunit TctC
MKLLNGSESSPVPAHRPILERLSVDTNRILNMPEMKERLLALGMDVRGTTPEEFSGRIGSEMPKWAKVVKTAGIKPE